MTEKAKNKFIVILILVIIVSVLICVNACNREYRQKKARDREMFTRLDLEEKMSNVEIDITNMQQKIKKLGRELDDEKAAHQNTKEMMVKVELANRNLKQELDELIKAKTALEKELEDSRKENAAKTRSSRYNR